MKGQKSLFLLLAFSFLSIKGFIYKVDILRKWDPMQKKFSYFIGCSDFHDKFHAANGPQRQFIRRLLVDCDKTQTKVLVEDLASANHDGKSDGLILAVVQNLGFLLALYMNVSSWEYQRPTWNTVTIEY